jgi:cell division protein FtsZ
MDIPTINPYLNLPHSTEMDEETYTSHKPILKVIGLGGGGSNAIGRMMELGLKGVDFIVANTDFQVLKNNPAPVKIQLGQNTTRGLGAGGNPEVGRAAALESESEITEALKGADMVFVTAGMGGGTGTGAIPVVAEIARNLGIVVIAVVTTPFSFEMARRQKSAQEGISKLRQFTNTLISIPNDRLLLISPKDITLEIAFHLADDVLRQAVQGITELITETGMINVDFSHIKRLMLLGGGAYMSIGHGHGEHRARQAVEQALHHPLLDEVSIDHAAGIIANFTSGTDLTLYDVQDALSYLQGLTTSNPDIILGVTNDPNMQNRVQVILIVTGMGGFAVDETIATVNNVSKNSYIQTQNTSQEPLPVASHDYPPLADLIPAGVTTDYDLPAFIRKRSKQAM